MPTLPVGTPLRKLPTVSGSGSTTQGSGATSTAVVPPADTTDDHSDFVGVTTRNNETYDATDGGEVYVQKDGVFLVRVNGLCEFDDPLEWVNGQDYLQKGGGNANSIVCYARMDKSSAAIGLIKASITGKSVGAQPPVWI